jgi:hypothetical protein
MRSERVWGLANRGLSPVTQKDAESVLLAAKHKCLSKAEPLYPRPADGSNLAGETCGKPLLPKYLRPFVQTRSGQLQWIAVAAGRLPMPFGALV